MEAVILRTRCSRRPRSAFGATFLAACATLMLSACQSDAPEEADGSSGDAPPNASVVASAEGMDPKAVAVADRVMEALGGREAWDRTRYISWNFFGVRRHYWDKWTGDLRIEKDSLIILTNVHTKIGQARKGQTPVDDLDELAQLMKTSYEWWINDSYWMFMPYKLRDPGVKLAYGGEKTLDDGTPVEMLVLTFDDGTGLTPGNKYEVAVSTETDLIVSWTFYERADDKKPRFTLPWAGWEQFGEIKLATKHGQGRDWDISVPDELPRSLFQEFQPVAS